MAAYPLNESSYEFLLCLANHVIELISNSQLLTPFCRIVLAKAQKACWPYHDHGDHGDSPVSLLFASHHVCLGSVLKHNTTDLVCEFAGAIRACELALACRLKTSVS